MANITEHQYLQQTAMNGRVFRPLVQVSFHTESGVYHAKSKTKNRYGEIIDPNQVITAVMTQKQLDAPAGMWSMNLEGTQWSTRINSQDIAVIQMGYAGETRLTTVMVGLVDKVNKKRSVGGDGNPSVSTSITGRDFGKLFVKDLLKFYPEISGKKASDFFLTDVGWINLIKVFTTDNIMKGTPAVIIDNIMKYIFPKIHNVSWKLWQEKSQNPASKKVNVKDIVGYRLAKTDFFMPFIFTADQYEGALWNLFERAAPKVFTEMFIDTRSYSEAYDNSASKKLVPGSVDKSKGGTFSFGQDGARVVICLRETPYDTASRSKLVRHKIAQEDVTGEDLNINDEQHYNLFWAGTTVNPLGIDLKRVAPPMLNEADAKKFGLAPLEVSIEGMEITDKLVLEGMSRTYTGKLKEWFQLNHKLWSGTIEIRGNASIRVGHIVEHGNPGEGSNGVKEYYVEGVSQNFNLYQGWTTTLTVTRGMAVGTVIDSSKHIWSPPKPKPKAAPKGTFYTVVKGDTLWDIAKRKYGDPLKWRRIWEANKSMLIKRDRRNASDHGHWIYPGQKLVIPPK